MYRRNQISQHLFPVQNLDPFVKSVVNPSVLHRDKIGRNKRAIAPAAVPSVTPSAEVALPRAPRPGRVGAQVRFQPRPRTKAPETQTIAGRETAGHDLPRDNLAIGKAITDSIQGTLVRSNMAKAIRKRSDPVILPFKVAIMIHLYDSKKVTNSLLVSILKILTRYDKSNFHWYINIANSHNACQLKAMVDHMLKGKTPHLCVMFNQNRGGDIGGLLLLSQAVANSVHRYSYCYFFHTKSNNNWRYALVGDVSNVKLETLDEVLDFGLVGSKKHLHRFTYHPNCHYEYHLRSISESLGVPLEQGESWHFIGGTIFLMRAEIVEFLGRRDLSPLYRSLNTPDTVDINWQAVVGDHLKKNLRGANNDYHYRQLYKCSLHSDFMIEHTFERFIGYLVKHLKLKVYGAGGK
jgi:hypothetical protein